MNSAGTGATHEQRAGRLLFSGALTYTVLVVYGSLVPLTELRDGGQPPLGFLTADFPRYWTAFDLVANVALYAPLGALWGAWLLRRKGPAWTVWAAVFAMSAFSLAIETTQNWLPSRVPSNIDWLCNSLGAALGALLSLRWPAKWRALPGVVSPHLRHDEPGVEAGCLLLAIWCLLQLSPENLLLCSGLVGQGGSGWLTPGLPRLGVEAGAVALHALLAGLMARQIFAARHAAFFARLLFVVLLLIAAKAVVSALGLGFSRAFVWMSNGVAWGLLFGLIGLLPACLLPPAFRRMLLPVLLILGSALLLLLPASPYVPEMRMEIAASPVRNLVETLNGLGLAWPLLAAVWLAWRASRVAIVRFQDIKP